MAEFARTAPSLHWSALDTEYDRWCIPSRRLKEPRLMPLGPLAIWVTDVLLVTFPAIHIIGDQDICCKVQRLHKDFKALLNLNLLEKWIVASVNKSALPSPDFWKSLRGCGLGRQNFSGCCWQSFVSSFYCNLLSIKIFILAKCFKKKNVLTQICVHGARQK